MYYLQDVLHTEHTKQLLMPVVMVDTIAAYIDSTVFVCIPVLSAIKTHVNAYTAPQYIFGNSNWYYQYPTW